MNRHLLDVNVLLALVWPRHESHDAAHAWFAKSGHKAWATSPLTQLGVLRLLTNPAVTQGAVSAAAALEAVDEATRHEGHEFWPLDGDMTIGLKTLAARLEGHRQWTDAVLLWQATEHGGVLVSFDSGVKTLAPRDAGDRVLILKRG
jgi:toxin-antitoxin system PIN domain toxin